MKIWRTRSISGSQVGRPLMSPADIVKSINMSQAETKVGHLKIWPFIGCNTDISVDFGAGTMVKGIASPDEGL